MAEGRETSNKTDSKTEWNLNKYKVNLIGGLMEKSIYYSLRGDHFRNFNCWRHINLLIKNRLDEREQKQLNLLKENVAKCMIKIPVEERKSFDNEKFVYKRGFPLRVEEYIDYLNELLRKIGLDLEDSSDKGFFG